jgi:hemin uptake protein HemP
MDAWTALPFPREETNGSGPSSVGAPGPARWSSRALLGDERWAVIVHEGVEYRLQLTRQNKLLLTK